MEFIFLFYLLIYFIVLFIVTYILSGLFHHKLFIPYFNFSVFLSSSSGHFIPLGCLLTLWVHCIGNYEGIGL